jgi:hypothetical protein
MFTLGADARNRQRVAITTDKLKVMRVHAARLAGVTIMELVLDE